MSHLPTGCSLIESVVANSVTVASDEGFAELQINEEEILIGPVGIRFLIVDAKDEKLTLVADEQVYFANYQIAGRDLLINLNRPEITDTIKIHARIPEDSMNTAEREVIQV